MDPAKIEAMLGSLRGGVSGLHSLLIVRHGYLVSETYFPGFGKDSPAELYSVTKSVISTLYGIAADKGKVEGPRLGLAQVLDFGTWPNPDPRKGMITAEDLLTMRSGLDWTEGNEAYAAFYRSPDQLAFVAGGRMRGNPGSAFNYDSGSVHLLSALLGMRTGMPAADFAKRELFSPLGIRDFSWEKDRQGRSIGGWGLRMKPRDMAKLGYLMLKGGRWDGRQVVSASWVEKATKVQVADTGSAEGLGYGYLWWLLPKVEGFAALGLDGQAIIVVPKKDLVVVVTASTPDHGHKEIFPLFYDYIVPAVQ